MKPEHQMPQEAHAGGRAFPGDLIPPPPTPPPRGPETPFFPLVPSQALRPHFPPPGLPLYIVP